ncbi:MAG TPA: DUF4124 domain-containing protein [Agitococcus sp.]|nr:DUF4124 domain-containing protein [Agitococcus sp.]HMV61236.1 DUF4124 domain-containing protein [Agitococcus sp.]HMX98359.1 DUF4124 domain-containing protein [Agitococcus sp.]HNA21408.1 DUF4124 domain-containing protein [Agitococcus sp.]HNC86204.1 DUF4124 domain-containing protein [Agitococcus sp.]
MRLVVLCCLLSANLAQAEIYKTYDKNGNVIFSDVPSADAQHIEAKPIATVPALPRNVIDQKLKPQKDDKKLLPTSYNMTINGLASEAVLQKEQETFNLGIQFEPALAKEHTLQVFLDGQDMGKNNLSPQINPRSLERGQHRLEFKVLDAKQSVMQTQAIDFFIQQPSTKTPKK